MLSKKTCRHQRANRSILEKMTNTQCIEHRLVWLPIHGSKIICLGGVKQRRSKLGLKHEMHLKMINGCPFS